ncbi:hypothetical protein FACS189454_06870 [Planctomycetales bacterium]|nr:hypothetical protein FACS189454_06870 [Planctomycetales bacterium]
MSVQIERTAIFEGETLLYQLTLTDTNPIDAEISPDISALRQDFLVQELPKQQERTGVMSSKVVINGKVIQDEKKGGQNIVRFVYVLTPKKNGEIVIPLPKVAAGFHPALQPQSLSVDEGRGKMNADGSITITVKTLESQDTVIMRIVANRTKLYPLQPLDLTLVIQIKALTSNNRDRNPLSLLRQPPKLQIPWVVADGQLAQGLEPKNSIEHWLTSLQVPKSGFSINNLGGSQLSMGDDDLFSRPFSMNPFQRVLYQFADTPKKITRIDAAGNDTDYWEYCFTRTFTAKKTGDYSFGPVSLKGILPIDDSGAEQGVSGKTIYALAKTLAVTVADVPESNRPNNYIGAFGSYRWEADIVPKKAKVGDPMTLTLRLTGQGSTANVKPPELTEPAIAENFKVHTPPSEENNEQTCTFTYTIRPQRAGILAFPAISVSVFNVNTEQFDELRSEPITLEIADAQGVDSATVYGKTESGAAQNPANTISDETISVWAIFVSKILGAVIAGVAGLFALWFIARRLADAIKRKSQNRRRNALSRAFKRIGAIDSATNADRFEQIKILQDVLFGFVADKTDSIEDGMTTADAVEKLREQKVSEETLREVQRFSETIDAMLYGGVKPTASFGQLSAETKRLLNQIAD